MADYFVNANNAEAAGGAPAAAPANGDAPMEDEIMVSSALYLEMGADD
jgi:THO complex subunit 4